MIKVWIKLDDATPSKVTVDDGADVDDLKKAIKKELADGLGGVSHNLLKVFAANADPSSAAALRGDKILKELIDEWKAETPSVSINYDHPLIVVAPAPNQAQAPVPPAPAADAFATEVTKAFATEVTKALERMSAENREGFANLGNILEGMQTEKIPMSKAGTEFTKLLLGDLNVKHFILPVNEETGEETGGQSMDLYKWKKGEREEDGQKGCQDILEREMLPFAVDGHSICMFDARNYHLPVLKYGKRESGGYSDLALGPEKSMTYAVKYAQDLVLSYTVALVELKTAYAQLKQGQLLLELVSLAVVSGMGQGVVLLGTDCSAKWQLLHFSDCNKVVVQPYTHGKKCIADFKTLIAEGQSRKEKNAVPEKLASITEDDVAADFPLEKDVNMKEFGFEESPRDKAIQQEVELRKLADALGSMYGETLEIPSWVRASETCPSYYM